MPATAAAISTQFLGKRSANQPITRNMGIAVNSSSENNNTAACWSTPLLIMIGMMCSMTAALATNRKAVPNTRTQ